jgi:hypothetical protein
MIAGRSKASQAAKSRSRTGLRRLIGSDTSEAVIIRGCFVGDGLLPISSSS